MKNNRLIFVIVLVLCALFTACQNDQFTDNVESSQRIKLELKGGKSRFSDGTTPWSATRASTAEWQTNDMIFLIFDDGNIGYALYSESEGFFITFITGFPKASGTATLRHFENIKVSSETYCTLSGTSAEYILNDVPYSYSNSVVAIQGTLVPNCARMRFKGDPGQQVAIKGFSHLSTYNYINDKIGKVSDEISLIIKSDGYTDYIYGYPDESGNLTITYNGETLEKNVSSATLPNGASGYIDLKNQEDNADVDVNAYVVPDFSVSFTDGFCNNWMVGSSASIVYTCIFKDLSQYENDNAIIDAIKEDNEPEDAQSLSDIISLWSSLPYEPNTTYYMCTIAYNSSGIHGPLQKVELKTNPTTLPIATISNLELSSDNDGNCWTYDITLSNGASKYYLIKSEDDEDLDYDDHFLAFYMNNWIKNGNLTNLYDYTSIRHGRSSTKCMIVTYAVDSKGNLGNYNCARYPTSSLTKVYRQSKGKNANVNSFKKQKKLPMSKLHRPIEQYNVFPFLFK